MSDVTDWQARALELMCAVVFFEPLRVQICERAALHDKHIYLALCVRPDGGRDILGLWR